jgi:thiol-disulfide isomerase/thioredoxin
MDFGSGRSLARRFLDRFLLPWSLMRCFSSGFQQVWSHSRAAEPSVATLCPWLAGIALFGVVGCSPMNLEWLSSAEPEPAEQADTGGAEVVSAASPLELVGQSAAMVEQVLGQPSGRLITGTGVVWLYPQWRVQLDAQQQVTSVERELGVSAQTAPRGGSAPMVRAATIAQRDITVISKGGQEVNLVALLAPGKITVVDFYADWCGPCRQVSPHLERLAREDPEVNLVKVDIVKWNTPVTRQFDIRSVPNMRVYDRAGRVVGAPTSNFQQVLKDVQRAKSS